MAKQQAIPSGEQAFFDDPHAALRRVQEIYSAQVEFLRSEFTAMLAGQVPSAKVSACYPYIEISTDSDVAVDNRTGYGFVPEPGRYATTLTRPDLFADYLLEQFTLLRKHHAVPLKIGVSDMPIPVHFAGTLEREHETALTADSITKMSAYFDMPKLAEMDDRIVNNMFEPAPGQPSPLALFTAPRVDFSLARLLHYTATSPEHFQHFVLFTNYQFYVDEFIRHGKQLVADAVDDYVAFVEPGDCETRREGTSGTSVARLPQMPAYHLKRADRRGITMVNIGVGPSNAKTITDHIAVLRPHAWLMLGHCAGLRNTQQLGDYVLAHGYVREDHVLDEDLPTWVPLPPLAEVQIALEQAVRSETKLSDYAVKRVMRTGTVASVDDRNWELRDYRYPERRLRQSRAIALDMESATIAGNGFRFRVPYGTLLCVSDKPLHGHLKLAGMANSFYREQVERHLLIGIRAIGYLRQTSSDQLHSRKLRSFAEVAFR